MKRKLENLEDHVTELEKKCDNALEEHDELAAAIEGLKRDEGLNNVYKDIIKSSENTQKLLIFVTIILSITIVVLIIITYINQKEFTAYRENSITKIEILNALTEDE